MATSFSRECSFRRHSCQLVQRKRRLDGVQLQALNLPGAGGSSILRSEGGGRVVFPCFSPLPFQVAPTPPEWGGGKTNAEPKTYFDQNKLIMKNSCAANGINYELGTGDTAGPIVSASDFLLARGDASHPWANFSLVPG